MSTYDIEMSCFSLQMRAAGERAQRILSLRRNDESVVKQVSERSESRSRKRKLTKISLKRARVRSAPLTVEILGEQRCSS